MTGRSSERRAGTYRSFVGRDSGAGSLEELAQLESLPATQPMPPEIRAILEPDPPGVMYLRSPDKPQLSVLTEQQGEYGLWRARLQGGNGEVLGGLPGFAQETVSTEVIAAEAAGVVGGESYRPPWVAAEFYPRLRPFRPVSDDDATDFRVPTAMQTRDSMTQLTPNFWPWHCIGKVIGGFDSEFDRPRVVGTAALVGRNTIITAGHCAVRDRPPGRWWMRFFPSWDNGPNPAKGDSFVQSWRGPNFSGPGHGDFAVCKLYKPLGEALGFMGAQWASDDDFYEDRRWTSVGYPDYQFGGQRPVVGSDLKVVDVDDSGDSSEIEFSLNSYFRNGGWSGGPLWAFIDTHPSRRLQRLGGRRIRSHAGRVRGWEADVRSHRVESVGAQSRWRPGGDSPRQGVGGTSSVGSAARGLSVGVNPPRRPCSRRWSPQRAREARQPPGQHSDRTLAV